MSDEQHYTFGDTDAAAERLELLARAFEPSTRDWLATLPLAVQQDARVVDLGCGPGLTTGLLGQQLSPEHLYGLDRSERLIDRARQSGIAVGARFFVHDVTQGPFPVPPATLLYARFLLTHLASPARVLAVWAQALAQGGRLLLEEVAAMESEHPAFQRYYALVEALQAHYGQVTYIGARMPELVHGTSFAIEHARVQEICVPAAAMARLHALNLQTWSQDAYAQSAFDGAELAGLAQVFASIAAGAAAPPVTCRMAQVCLRKSA